MRSRSVCGWIVFTAVASMMLVPAGSASADEKKWRMRIVGGLMGGDGGVQVAGEGQHHFGVAIDAGAGAGISFEYAVAPKMGFEMGVMALGATVGVVGGSKHHHPYGWGGEVASYVPFTFGFNYHPIKNPGVLDFYVGPLIAPTINSRVGTIGSIAVETRTDLGLGVNLGLDINFGQSRWSLNTGLKYISIVTNNGGGNTRVAADPLIFTFGFGFRF